MAHPSLGLCGLDRPELIAESVLLEFEGDPSPCWQWNSWLEMQGWSGVKPKGIVRFNLYDQMIHAAVAGQGIALGRGQFIQPMLDDGRLRALPTPHAGPQSNKVVLLVTGRVDAGQTGTGADRLDLRRGPAHRCDAGGMT
ncbi:MAG: hypothetical protein H7Z39_07700 [Burkholderiaceae bacterium]|nr:hypothetical protein [Burkholderiaceae bacterium]